MRSLVVTDMVLVLATGWQVLIILFLCLYPLRRMPSFCYALSNGLHRGLRRTVNNIQYMGLFIPLYAFHSFHEGGLLNAFFAHIAIAINFHGLSLNITILCG